MYARALTIFSLLMFAAPAIPQAPDKAPLPKVVLIGDSIRMGYAPLVAKKLAGKAVVVSHKDNGGDSGNVLKNLEEWVIKEKPDVVHLNCGLHDLKQDRKSKKHQVELDQYEKNLRQLVDRIRKETGAAFVFATTTPIHDERHAKRGAGFERTEADVQRYNQVALKVMKEAGIVVHDLHWVVEQGGSDKLLGGDGTHYTPAGSERLAAAVSDCVQRQLIIRRSKPSPPPPSGPKAAADYKRNEAERDAQVPQRYKNLPFGKFELPKDTADWKARRSDVLKKVVQSLGELPPRPSPTQARRVTRELRPGYVLEKIVIDNGVDDEVSMLMLIPEKQAKPAPAILWLHSSTPDKTHVIVPNTYGGAEPLGEVLIRAGYVVLAPDAYWHGDRENTGPAGTAEPYRAAHDSFYKYQLWFGRTLWGMFVRDDQIALDYLCSRPEVDKGRIGATGMSMGSTRSYWLAAVDDRVACAVGVACLTRYENLIKHGNLRAHGGYFFTYGLLKHFDVEGVFSLIAPRPYLALTGDLDYGSPADGIKVVEDKMGQLYKTLGASDRFKNILYPEVGHTVTPEMRSETLAWFARWLKPEGGK